MLEMEREEVPSGPSRATVQRMQGTPVEHSTNARYGKHHAD